MRQRRSRCFDRSYHLVTSGASRLPRSPPRPYFNHMERIPGYRDLELIGQGTFAVVYRAVQERFDRAVALKVLSVGLVDADTLQRFRLECRLVGKLTGHPN